MPLIVLITCTILFALTFHVMEGLYPKVYAYGMHRAEITYQQSEKNRLRGYVLLNRILRPLEMLKRISPEAANICWIVAGICLCILLWVASGPNL
jgi:hypothetical protein